MEDYSQIGLWIAQIHQISDRIFEQKLRTANLDNLSAAQGRVLFILEANDKIMIQDLASLVSLSNSSLTQLLDKLEKKEVIARKRSDTDRRKIHILKGPDFLPYLNIYKDILREMTKMYYIGFD